MIYMSLELFYVIFMFCF